MPATLPSQAQFKSKSRHSPTRINEGCPSSADIIAQTLWHEQLRSALKPRPSRLFIAAVFRAQSRVLDRLQASPARPPAVSTWLSSTLLDHFEGGEAAYETRLDQISPACRGKRTSAHSIRTNKNLPPLATARRMTFSCWNRDGVGVHGCEDDSLERGRAALGAKSDDLFTCAVGRHRSAPLGVTNTRTHLEEARRDLWPRCSSSTKARGSVSFSCLFQFR